MPNLESDSTKPDTGKPGADARGGTAAETSAESWTPVELSRWADAVASSQAPFPDDLTANRAERLMVEVARRRRKLLVTFVARAIARDIQDGFRETTRR